MGDTQSITKTKVNTAIKPPNMFKIIYMNDDATTVEFVIESIVAIFNHSRSEAEALTMLVHEEGSAVVAILPYEMAEQKGVEVITLARNNGFPLQIKIERE